LFAEYNFLVGVSIDGPRELHDAERKDRGGHGSFERVMAGLDLIRRREIDFNVLCVVGPHNVAYARELMRFFRRERIGNLQFIPAMDFQAMQPERPPAYLVTPQEYGEFLVQLFDDWYGEGTPTISIRIFNNFLQSFLGVPNDLCVHGDSCDAGLVVEYNGDLYPCDFYMHPTWKLGNVFEHGLQEMCTSRARTTFIGQKQPLPAECQACEYRQWCKGGCPRNRMSNQDGSDAPDYFCASYKRFFAHAEAKLGHLSDRMINRFRYLEQVEVLPPAQRVFSRNDACPCGSGRKHKACCGNESLARSYLSR
jgi:uncharacterized protein